MLCTHTEPGNREVYALQGLIGNMVGSEVVLGAAALAFAHSRLGKLMPAFTIPPRPLANSLAQVKAGAQVLTLEYTGTTEVPWSCPLLRDLAWVEPAVTRHLAVDIPLAVGAKGEIRAFRPFAYLEKLLLQLEAARLKVRSTQPFDLLDMWTLLKSLSAHCSLRPGSLSLNCLSFVLPTQSDYTRIYIYPASPPSISPSIDLKTGSGLVLSPQQIVLDSHIGPIFAVDSKGNIATPRLSTESGQWTGVRPNIMRDSLLVVYSVEARSCTLSRLMEVEDIKEVFIANDRCFLIPINSISHCGLTRSFPSLTTYTHLKSSFAAIHVLPRQQGLSPTSSLCRDHYTEELWSQSLSL